MSLEYTQSANSNEMKEKQTKLIGHWLYKLKNGEINDEILFISNKYEDPYKVVQKLFKNFVPYSMPLIISNNDVLKTNEHEIRTRNVIYTSSKMFTFEQFNKCQKPILLFANKDHIEEKMIDTYFEKIIKNIDAYTIPINISIQERYQFCIELKDMITLLNANSEEDIEKFIIWRLFEYRELLPALSPFIHRICKQTNYEGFHEEEIKELILRDLKIFKTKSKLTSRLGVILYRLTNMDLKVDKTTIGKHLSKVLNIESKNSTVDVSKGFSNHSKMGKNRFLEYNKKIFKLYDISELKPIIKNKETRIEIAKNLLSQNIPELTLERIEIIVGISRIDFTN